MSAEEFIKTKGMLYSSLQNKQAFIEAMEEYHQFKLAESRSKYISDKETFNETQIKLLEMINYISGTEDKDVALGYLGVFESILNEQLLEIRGKINRITYYIPGKLLGKPDNIPVVIFKEIWEILDTYIKK